MAEWKSAIASIASDVEDAFDRRWDALKVKLGLGEPLRIVPYRGYRTPERVVLRGRVLEEEDAGPPAERDSIWDNLARWWDRVESDEVPGARVLARFEGEELELVTDDEGYFELAADLPFEGGPELAWQEVDLELVEPVKEGEPARATGRVLAPAAAAGFGVISDLDDTIVRTGATSKLRMARVIFLNNARSRSPFAGVAAFYRALQRGTAGRPVNPVFYVSASPWNYYRLFDHYLDFHDIPPGPIFLKDFGLEEEHLFKEGHEEYKLERIETLLAAYPDLDFVLVGDSGQSDPETYLAAIEEHPGRILAAYLRDVTADEGDAEVREIAARAAEHGVDVVLAATTREAARHAAGHGLIDEGALDEIEADAARDEKEGGVLERLFG